MFIYKNRYNILFEIIAIVLVCLPVANDISWAQPTRHSTSNSTLATQSIFNPIIDAVGIQRQKQVELELSGIIAMALRGLKRDSGNPNAYRSFLNINSALDKRCGNPGHKDKGFAERTLEVVDYPKTFEDDPKKPIVIRIKTTVNPETQKHFKIIFKGDKLDDMFDVSKVEVIEERAAPAFATMPATSACENEKIKNIFSEYRDEEVREIIPMAKNIAGKSSFLIETVQGNFVLSERTLRTNPELLMWEGTLMEGLKVRGFLTVPQIYKTKKGEFFVKKENSFYVLHEYKVGEKASWGTVSGTRLINTAKEQAKYHNVVKSITLTGQNLNNSDRQYPLGDILNLSDMIKWFHAARDALPDEVSNQYPHAIEALHSNFGLFESQIGKIKRNAPPQGYASLPQLTVHGDYNPNNLLFTGDNVTGLLDFEYARKTARLMDLANGFMEFPNAISEANQYQYPIDFEKLVAYLRAYQDEAENKLTAEELKYLPEAYRAWFLEGISMIISLLYNENSTSTDEQIAQFINGNAARLNKLDESINSGKWQHVIEEILRQKEGSQPPSAGQAAGLPAGTREHPRETIDIMHSKPGHPENEQQLFSSPVLAEPITEPLEQAMPPAYFEKITGILQDKKFASRANEIMERIEQPIKLIHKWMPPSLFQRFYNDRSVQGGHAIPHALDDLIWCLTIIRDDSEISTEEVDFKSLCHAVIFHDLANILHRENHQVNSIIWMESILKKETGYSEGEVRKIKDVLDGHWKVVDNKKMPGHEKYVEARLLHDADMLDSAINLDRVYKNKKSWPKRTDWNTFFRPDMPFSKRFDVLLNGPCEEGDGVTDIARHVWLYRDPGFYLTQGGRQIVRKADNNLNAVVEYIESKRDDIKDHHKLSDEDIGAIFKVLDVLFKSLDTNRARAKPVLVTQQSSYAPALYERKNSENISISNDLLLLNRASKYLEGYPVDETIDLSLIPKEDLEANMKTWAYIIALNNNHGLDTNYIFKSDDEAYRTEAKRMLFEKVQEIKGIDIEKIKARIIDIYRPGALQVHIMKKEDLEKLKDIPENVLPVALSEGTALEGTPLRDFMSASVIGLAQAALKKMRIEKDPHLLEILEKEILPRMQRIYQSLFPDKDIKEIVTKETILNMIDDNPIVRKNLAIALALPPIIRAAIQHLKDYHDRIHLLQQAA